MKVLRIIAILTAAFGLPASASVIIDWVTVGNSGNAADTADGDSSTTGVQRYGAVGYEYQIGKYEVTNAQYAEFLNAKAATDNYSLYNTSMASFGITRTGSSGSYSYAVSSGFENKPVVYVSWYDAARFSNWLSNGQGSGDTETGSYNLNGLSSGLILPIADAKIRLPSEDEWYKAAYYNGVNSTYSLYPNGQNTITTADANYDNSVGFSTDVGTYSGDPSMYGTFDQGGNVWEWNDTVIGSSRGLRGGTWGVEGFDFYLASSCRPDVDLSGEFYDAGFRLAAPIPEPSSMVLAMLASGVMLVRRKR
jgi:sulfatase modifying factor 1